jgi:hypothetical protein
VSRPASAYKLGKSNSFDFGEIFTFCKLNLQRVLSSHCCQIKIPHNRPKFVKNEIINPKVGKGQEPIISVDRYLVTYGPPGIFTWSL